MNLKELIKEVERLKEEQYDIVAGTEIRFALPTEKLKIIKQTIEAINSMKMYNQFGVKTSHYESKGEFDDWQTLKKLLNIK